jgi:hypothetical protein
MLRLTILTTVAAALLWGEAYGQDPAPAPKPIPPSPDGIVYTISGPDRIDPYKLGVYSLPFDGAELDETPNLDVLIRGQEAIITGPPGRYTLVARWGEIVGTRVVLKSARKVVQIGTPPGPVDPLINELRILYASDPSPTKGQDVKDLAAIYELMASEAGKPEYKTAGDVGKRYKAAVTIAIDGRLIPLRTRCSKDVDAASPDAEAQLTDSDRKKLATAFTKLSTLLPQVIQ